MERYRVVRYSRFWWGIMDHTLNKGKGLLMRVGPNPNYEGPLDDKDNKLLLFKNRDEAQKYADNNLNSSLKEDVAPVEIKVVHTKWDPERKCLIVSKKDYDEWDD